MWIVHYENNSAKNRYLRRNRHSEKFSQYEHTIGLLNGIRPSKSNSIYQTLLTVTDPVSYNMVHEEDVPAEDIIKTNDFEKINFKAKTTDIIQLKVNNTKLFCF